jgi:hypothetical protein
MNSLELAEHRLLVSMFVDAHRPDRRYLTQEDFQHDYQVDVDTRLFNSIVVDLRKQGIVKTSPQGGTYAVRLHGDGHKTALSRILKALDADTFEVDWQTKRISYDAEECGQDSLIPRPCHWMLLNSATKEAAKLSASASPHYSASQIVGRDINHFYGDVVRQRVSNQNGKGGDGGWTKWGTIFGGLGVITAIAAIVAAWYFWRYSS